MMITLTSGRMHFTTAIPALFPAVRPNSGLTVS
jgi:hypothetical protein